MKTNPTLESLERARTEFMQELQTSHAQGNERMEKVNRFNQVMKFLLQPLGLGPVEFVKYLAHDVKPAPAYSDPWRNFARQVAPGGGGGSCGCGRR